MILVLEKEIAENFSSYSILV